MENLKFLCNPLGKNHQPSQALSFIIRKRNGLFGPPLAPATHPSGAALDSIVPPWKPGYLPELCQLALLWAIAGQQEAANNLANWLAPVVEEVGMLPLWCPERDYEEQEGLLSFSLLLRAIGREKKAAELLAKVRTPIDPFYMALAKEEIHFAVSNGEVKDPDLGIHCFRAKTMTTALTLSGEKTSLGVIHSWDVQIRAMGPQGLPLSDTSQFGISCAPNSSSWTRCFAFPQVWFEVKILSDEAGSTLDLRFLGLELEKPLAFVFYVKALSCSVGDLVLKPKSLHRYKGEATHFLFRGALSQLRIDARSTHKVQVIPLAGEGGFWNCDFLLSFEISPIEAAAHFKISDSD